MGNQCILAGDSLAVGLGRPLRQVFSELVVVAQDGRRSDEEQHIPADARMVIISLGTNDADPRAPLGWEEEYGKRLGSIMAHAPTAKFLWLLPPTMEDAGFEFFVAQRRAVIRQVAAASGAMFLKPWPDSKFLQFLGGIQIREEDGIHFTPEGYRLWAERIVAALG